MGNEKHETGKKTIPNNLENLAEEVYEDDGYQRSGDRKNIKNRKYTNPDNNEEDYTENDSQED